MIAAPLFTSPAPPLRVGLAGLWALTVIAAFGLFPRTARAQLPGDQRLQAPGSDSISDAERTEIEALFGGASDADAGPSLPSASGGPAGIARAFQSMNPDMSLILDTAAAAYSSDPLQTGAHDARANGFNFQQLELSTGAAVDPFFRFDSNIVFSPFGVEVEEAYATTSALPANLQLRAGQFLTRFGRLNATHPHAWHFADQPLISGKFFGGEGNRGLGAEMSWLTPLPWYVEVAGSLTDAAGEATARSFFGRQNPGVASPADLELCTLIKQYFPIDEDLSVAWGLSGAFGPNPTGRTNRSEIYGTDLYVKYRPISGENVTTVGWTTEAMVRRRQIPGGVLVDAGGYSSLFWQFALGWAAAARYETVSGTTNDYADPDWTGNRQRMSANLTWWPTEFSRIRLQGNADFPSWRADPIYGAVLNLEVVTGAHGAHAF